MSACTFSLADDILPPPGSDLSGEIVANIEFEFPSSDIDLNDGAAIYSQSCAPCHGDSGLGDGRQAGELPFSPAPIGERDFALENSFEEWFLQISNGDIEKLMPPFANPYSVQERWNVLAYVLSLGIQNNSGEQTFDISLVPEEYRSLSKLAKISGIELFDIISNELKSQSEDATDEMIWSLVDQAQSLALGLGNLDPEPVVDQPVNRGEIPESSDILGLVINASGGQAPAELDVVLHVMVDGAEISTIFVPVDQNGEFKIEDFSIQADHLYFFSADFQSLNYFSPFYSAELFLNTDVVEIEIFESSRDVSNLEVELINIVFKFPAEGIVQVIEQVVISNHGNNAAAPGEGGAALINYQLPDEATNVIFEQGVLGDRYIVQEMGFGDIRAVLPGQDSYQLLFAYQMPYRNSLHIEIPLQFPTNEFVLFVPIGDIRIDSEDFIYEGQQSVQADIFESHLYSGSLEEGDAISISLSGNHPFEQSVFEGLTLDRSFLIGLLALALSIALGWWWFRSTESEPEGSTKKRSKKVLLDEIVDLDQQLALGEISKRKHEKIRNRLFQDLRQKVWKSKK